MYHDDVECIQEWLRGDYSESQLTLGSDVVAREHEMANRHDLAAINRMPIDRARALIIALSGYDRDLYLRLLEMSIV